MNWSFILIRVPVWDWITIELYRPKSPHLRHFHRNSHSLAWEQWRVVDYSSLCTDTRKTLRIWGMCVNARGHSWGLCQLRTAPHTVKKWCFEKTCCSINSGNHTSPSIFIFKTCHLYLGRVVQTRHRLIELGPSALEIQPNISGWLIPWYR